MLTNENISLILILMASMNSFVLGYCIGKKNSDYSIESGNNTNSPSFFKKENSKHKNINLNIDDTKFVGSINTDNMEKKYNSLGDTKQSQENIANSINKLKNIKS